MTAKKLLITLCVACVLVLSMAVCFASSGEAEFVEAFAAGYTSDALWGSLTPLVGIMITALIFAFAYRAFRRTGKGASKGKFNG